MKTQTLIIRSLSTLGIVIAIFIVGVITINLSIFDEELTPEVVTLLEPVEYPIEPGNAYIAFWGITASSEKDYYDAGVKLMEHYRSLRSKDVRAELSDAEFEEILGADDLDEAWLEKYPRCNFRKKYSCMQELSQILLKNPITSQRLSLMLNRYAEMIKLPNYEELMELHAVTSFPPFSTTMRLSKIRLSKAYNDEEKMNFLLQLKQDLLFWRMMLAQSDTVLDKMIAVASIWGDYQYLSEYLTKHSPSDSEKNIVYSLLTSLSREELNMAQVLEDEIRMQLKELNYIYNESEIDGEIWSDNQMSDNLSMFWLSQKNATLNQVYKAILPAICLSQLSVTDFYQAKIEKSNSKCGSLEVFAESFSLSDLYNPGGKLIVSTATPAYGDYIARVRDLNGVISLVKLQLEIKSTNPESLEDAIKYSDIKNPYTGKAMDYDKKENWLYFDCLDKNSSCRVKL